jgi:hypothetical protein
VSDTRAALESAQARLRELEASMPSEAQLSLMADQLEREAESFELALMRAETRAAKTQDISMGSRLLGFGFSLLFVTPIVAMIGVSLAKLIRHEFELSLVALISGLVMVWLVSWPRSTRAIARRFSAPWRLARAARVRAQQLRG